MSKWMEHLAQFRKKHPQLSLKQAMQQAKLTYKKGGSLVDPDRFKKPIGIKPEIKRPRKDLLV